MRMDEGMDTGPILAQAVEVIHPDDTAGSLHDRLAQQGADLLIATLPCYLTGELTLRPQDDAGATMCRLLKKEHARIDWTQTAEQIERMVRAYDPWPGAFTTWSDQNLKIGIARVVEGDAEPGAVVISGSDVAVGTGAGLLALDQVQLAGKKMMDIRDFLQGRPELVGAQLG